MKSQKVKGKRKEIFHKNFPALRNLACRCWIVIAGVLAVIFQQTAEAQTAADALHPSVFFTAGTYSKDVQSKAYDYYAAYTFSSGDYLDAGYEMVGLDHPSWTYDQSLAVIGGGINYYPFYFQGHYGRFNGKFDWKGFTYTYDDKGNVFNLLSSYNWDLFYFGFAYTYLEIEGYKNIKSHQPALRFDWVAAPSIVLSASPLYSDMSDGRKLFSMSVRGSYYPAVDLMLQLSGSFGERSYFFHPDILTLYNQDETQRMVLGLRAEYQIINPVTIAASYQYLEYDGFLIRSATVGVKGLISF